MFVAGCSTNGEPQCDIPPDRGCDHAGARCRVAPYGIDEWWFECVCVAPEKRWFCCPDRAMCQDQAPDGGELCCGPTTCTYAGSSGTSPSKCTCGELMRREPPADAAVPRDGG